MSEDPDAKFTAAVTRWLIAEVYGGAEVPVSNVEITCSTGACDTCGGVEVEISWSDPSSPYRSREIPTYDLGRWIGGLL